MNVLDKLKTVLDMADVKLGYMPDKPSTVIALFEYSGTLPDHHFGGTDFIDNVQVRCRADNSSTAYNLAKTVSDKLNRYRDGDISALQTTPILDLGYNNMSPQLIEYSINFTIRRF